MSGATPIPSTDLLDETSRTILDKWAPGARFKVRRLGGGRSGSPVFFVTIAGARDNGPTGEFVFKLSPHPASPGQNTEIEAHLTAGQRNRRFAKEHIPRLRKFIRIDNPPVCAMLYDPAGHSLDAYIGASEIQVASLANSLEVVVREILVAWANEEPTEELAPHELLKSWLGYRLEKDSSLRRFIDEAASDSATVNVGNTRLPNPLDHLLEPSQSEYWPKNFVFRCLLHGDLHPGNILLERVRPNEGRFFLVDFALSHEGYLGYDEAYLELGLLLSAPEIDSEVSLLKVLQGVAQAEVAPYLPRQLTSIVHHLRVVREASETWIQKSRSTWVDTLARQFALSRVAAGLNWANKKLPTEQRRMALAYAASSTQDYLERCHPETLEKAMRRMSLGTAGQSGPSNPTDTRFLDELWQFMHGYDASSARFILVSEALPRDGTVPFRLWAGFLGQ